MTDLGVSFISYTAERYYRTISVVQEWDSIVSFVIESSYQNEYESDLCVYGEYAKGRKSIKITPILFYIGPLKKNFEPLFLF